MHLLGDTTRFMNDFHVPTPTSSTLLLSLLFSLVLLAAIRLVFLAYGALSKVSNSKEKLSQQEKADPVQHGRRRWTSMMRWSWTWEGLPLSLPISFSFSDQQIIGGVVGNGIGVSAPPPPTMKAMLHGKRTGPAFEHPRTFNPFHIQSNFHPCLPSVQCLLSMKLKFPYQWQK